jgi:hypothetical protein
MEFFKIKRQSTGLGTLLFMLIFGGIFTSVGWVIMADLNISPDWKRATGTIVEVVRKSSSTRHGPSYAPIVEYKVEGQSYRVASSISSTSYPTIGKTKQVAYNPQNPEEAKVIDKIGMIFLLFPVIGILVIVMAVYAFIKSILREKEIKQLLAKGRKIEGVLVEVESSGSKNMSYRLVVSAVDHQGKVQNYKSDSLGGIGALAMLDYQINPIAVDVYLDPKNPQSYYVDIDDIPGLTPDRINQLLDLAKSKQVAKPSTLI